MSTMNWQFSIVYIQINFVHDVISDKWSFMTTSMAAFLTMRNKDFGTWDISPDSTNINVFLVLDYLSIHWIFCALHIMIKYQCTCLLNLPIHRAFCTLLINRYLTKKVGVFTKNYQCTALISVPTYSVLYA